MWARLHFAPVSLNARAMTLQGGMIAGWRRFGLALIALGLALRILVAPGMMPVATPQGMTLTLRSEEHTSELQSLMRISYAGFCLKKQKKRQKKYKQKSAANRT